MTEAPWVPVAPRTARVGMLAVMIGEWWKQGELGLIDSSR